MNRKTIFVYASIALATLIAAEALARVYDWTPSNPDAATGDDLGDLRYEHSYSGFGDLMPKQDGHWVVWFHRPYHVQTNSVGLRNVEEPNPAAFRILTLGDSQTFGPYLANEDTWPAWTENALRRRVSAPDNVQVFNGAVSGYTIVDQLAELKEKGLAFRPNLVVLAVFENDIFDLRHEHAGAPRRKSARGLAPGLSKRLRSRFAIAHVVHRMRRQAERALAGIDVRRGEANPVAPAGPAAPTAESGPAPAAEFDVERLSRRYNELFDETARLLKSANVPFAVVRIPTSQEVLGEVSTVMAPVIRDAARRNDVPLLEVADALRSVPDAVTRFYLLQYDHKTASYQGNAHTSREGNQVIGGAVADWLLTRSLVPTGQLASHR